MSLESKIIKFYNNNYPANNKKNYYLNDILTGWSDLQLETAHDFIQWLFPDEKGGQNSNSEKLTVKDVEIFKTDREIRKNVINSTFRMMNFYGYKIDVIDGMQKICIKRIKELKRKEGRTVIGLYSSHNYLRLTRMMIFLNKINMKILSSCIFMALNMAMDEDKKLMAEICKKNNGGKSSFDFWHETQTKKILEEDLSEVDCDNTGDFSKEFDNSEDEDQESEESENNEGKDESSDDDVEILGQKSREQIEFEQKINKIKKVLEFKNEPEKNSKITKFNEERYSLRGLLNINNSCYLDCILMPLLYQKNSYIDENIFKKNMSDTVKKDKGTVNDIKYITYVKGIILQELINIARKIRCEEKNKEIFNCSKFRSLISFYKLDDFEDFSSSSTQDASEFLIYLFDLFQIEKGIKERIDIMYSNDTKNFTQSQLKQEEKNCIITVDHFSLKNSKTLSDFLNYKTVVNLDDPYILDGTGYYIKFENSQKIPTSNFFIFNIQRMFVNQGNRNSRDATEIKLEEEIFINNKTFELTSIVVHRSNHYVAFLKKNETWLLYNDLSEDVFEEIGTFEDLLNIKKDNPCKNGTLYFYIEKV